MKLDLLTIKQAIASPQPEGWVSSMSSSKLVRPRVRPQGLTGPERHAAVMLLLFPDAEQTVWTVLTRRKETLQHHPGQISLPGGRQEDGETLERTALREVEEEIGVSSATIYLSGTLGRVYVPPSDFTVTPFVAWAESRPDFDLQAEEVAELLLIPLSRFMEPDARQEKSVASDSRDREVPLFEIDHHQIWGATAIILDDFIQRLLRTM